MNDVFEASNTGASQGETQQEPILQPGQVQEGAATPPVADTDKHVPLAALEDERSKRRDWKEKALRYEGELNLYRAQAQGGQPQGPQQPIDPEQAYVHRQETIILNASERMARKLYGDKDVDEAFARVVKNPAVHQQALQQADPWDFVVREGKRLAMLDEMGNDPVAYRARLEAEIRASLDPNAAPKTPPATPASLASARSFAARTAPGFTGPTPFNDIFK